MVPRIALILLACAALQASPIDYWNVHRRGANFFNEGLGLENLEPAKAQGIQIVRLMLAKWETKCRDYLVGNADEFKSIAAEDLAKIERFLLAADKLGMKVIIAPVSLPGARWKQQNGDKEDGRLWKDPKYREQALRFWKELASALKNYPAVAAFNIYNEPHPEKFTGFDDFWKEDIQAWYRKVENTPADLNKFNQELVKAIREVSPDMPIVVESGLYAHPWAFKYLKPVADDKVIYSFHMYEPFELTNKRINGGKYSYPGVVAVGNKKEKMKFDAKKLEEFLEPVVDWQKKHKINSNRILVGEFGCNRTVKGADRYLSDLIGIFNKQQWHWSFYAFREDTWGGMNYELGQKPWAEERWKRANKTKQIPVRGEGDRLMAVIRKGLSPMP